MFQVAVVEDDEKYRAHIVKFLNATSNYSCVCAYPDAESLLKDISQNRPDVILMDIELPGISGIDCLSEIKKIASEIEIIMLTVFEEPKFIFAALRNGASGYLDKTASEHEIITGINEVVEGGASMSPQICRIVIESFRNTDATPLSRRETDVLQRLCNGDSYKKAAGRLYISIGTVRHHIKNIYSKLHVHSKSAAVAKALKDKLVS